MRILVIADEVWNDRINGNNVLTNWFEGFPAEFAEIYATPGTPYNTICPRYFQITDGEMIHSLMSGRKAGEILEGGFDRELDYSGYNSTDVENLDFIRKHMGNLLRLMKTIVWNHGKINEKKLNEFITSFQPDIIFSARFAHSKIIRLERMALKYAKCPIVAFTGDNEYSLRRFSLSPIFWFNLLYQRNCLRKMMPNYAMYYTLSERQIEEYHRYFDIPMKVLRKCSPKPMGELIIRPVGHPIQIVYGGKLYAGRDKTIAALAKAIININQGETRYQLHIYTSSTVSNRMREILNDGSNTFMHQPVSSLELEKVYRKSDIALSVESFNLSLKLATRVSFSTKLIDCLYSTCAVMMIGWEENSGYEYLEKEKAAICIGNINEIEPVLKKIADHPELLQEYKKNAHDCMIRNHDRKTIQDGIYNDFDMIIKGIQPEWILKCGGTYIETKRRFTERDY